MQVKPWLVGACTVAAISGAVSGASLGSTPIQNRTDPLDEIIARQAAAPAQARVTALAGGPDHYALETPEGRIEVRDLESRGLFRDRPDRQLVAAQATGEAAMEAAIDQSQAVAEQVADFVAEPAVEMVAEPVIEQGGSRLVRVGAVLASR